ncbi:MAG: hypothetical protein JWQ13_3695 [Ramlibacter sp.]|jgi:hypothetical protein|nr:hypothetical protein [Ramlibacter sp.]
MSVTTRTLSLGLSALAASLPLPAQTAASAPSTPAAPAYQSAFEGYRPFEAGAVQDWRKSNETVREVGGWRAYAREMRGPARPPAAGASAPQSQAPAQPKAADPHAGHGK